MIRRIVIPFLFVTCGFVGGMVLTGRLRSAEEARAEPTQAPAPFPAPAAAAMLPDLSSVAARTIPSVMNITSLQVVRTQNSPFASDPLFRYFFGDQMAPPRNRLAQSLGSGVIVSRDGYILTNNHVIGDARAQVSVVMPDKRELKARIIGTDEWTDIALLKIDAPGLPTLPWGDSSKLRVAEWVLAIGNPFQLNQTVTLGIVSATNRRLAGNAGQPEDFIQTDAAINPGNSGGALINSRGELVGINSAIYSQSGGYQGIGFAVPSNLARQVMDDIIKYGSVRRGTLRGIQLAPLNPQAAAELGVQTTDGALLYRIDPRSDAYAAGLRQYDIVTRFNNRTVADPTELITLLAEAEIGSTVTLTVIRDRRERTVRVTVEQAATNRTRV